MKFLLIARLGLNSCAGLRFREELHPIGGAVEAKLSFCKGQFRPKSAIMQSLFRTRFTAVEADAMRAVLLSNSGNYLEEYRGRSFETAFAAFAVTPYARTVGAER